MLKESLQQVRARIAAAAQVAGRDPGSIRLVCVTKGIPVERIEEAIACGIKEIGENRVQEAREKKLLLEKGDRLLFQKGTVPCGDSPLRWHMVGTLQRNKAKFAVELFDVIHSIDSLELIEELDQQAEVRRKTRSPLEVLIQINVSGEATKHGCRPDQVESLARAISQSKNLKAIGLMTLAPYSEDPETARPLFRKLKELRDRVKEKFPSISHLSMGMSSDFEVAIQEGATFVRIGTAIFGGDVIAAKAGI